MTIIPLNEELVRTIGLTLLHFVWQGAALAAVFGIALLLLRRCSANMRYVAGCIALLLMAAAPVATFLYLHDGIAMRPANTTAVHTTVPEDPMLLELPATSLVSASSVAAEAQTQQAPRPPMVASSSLRVLDRALPWCVAAWGAGVLVLSLHMLAGWLHLQHVRRRGTQPAPLKWAGRLEALVQRMGVRRAVRLLQCARVDCPAVVGWVRPVILLPASAMSGLSVAQLESILAHELAHVRRHDYLINLVQSAIETVLFYHPAVWWVSQRVRQERENACDDVAAGVCGDRVMYADALATLEALRPAPSRLALAAGGGMLLPRIRRLLGRPAGDSARAGWLPSAAAALLVVAAVTATLHLSRSTTAAPGATAPKPPQPPEAPAALSERAAAPAQDATSTTNPATKLTPHEIAALDGGYFRPYLQKLDTLRIELEQAKSKLGEKNPKVQALRTEIDLVSQYIGLYADNFNKSFVRAPAAAPEPQMMANASPVQHEDLEPSELSGRIGPGDMLNISIRDLMGPGIESVNPQRVAPEGTITLPLVGAIEAGGKTAAELQTAISRTYHEAKIAVDLPVSVTVTESASQMFSVLGEVNRSGRYPLPRADFRLVEALAVAGGLKDEVQRVFVVRRSEKSGAQRRTLAIPIDPLLRGDLAMNVVIRPGDVVMAPPQVGTDVRAADVAKEELFMRQYIAATQPVRGHSVEESGVSVDEIARERREMKNRYERAREMNGPSHPTVKDFQRQLERLEEELARAVARRDERTGSYYISGVAKPGAYQLDGPMTLLQALVAAEYDIARGGGQYVTIVRTDAGDADSKTRAISINELMLAPEKGPPIRRGDLIIVRDGPATTRPVPPSGGVYYLGGLIQSPGAYEITSPITVLDALIAARLEPQAGKELYVTLIRGDGKREVHTMKVSELLASHGPIMHVQAGDRIMVSDKPPATQPAH